VAAARSWVDAGKAERWLEKPDVGLTLEEGWPRYHAGLKDGALVVNSAPPTPTNKAGGEAVDGHGA